MNAFRALIWLFGLVCCCIALSHIAIGPSVIPGSIPVNATMDSEDRFYATLFLGFGAAMIWCSRDLAARRGAFGALLLIFFLGGIARLVSWAAVGPPDALFIFLGALELILPPLLWLLNERLVQGRESGGS
ncbi:MAG: DUF4345 domain-containing protein [Altererythrobacter sp.]